MVCSVGYTTEEVQTIHRPMLKYILPASLFLFTAFTTACGEKVVSLTDDHNYTYAGTIDIPVMTTAAQTDLEICWPDVVEDIRCHEIDPGLDINQISLIRFPAMSELDLEDKLARDALLQSEQNGVVELLTEDDQYCANLSELTFFGTETDIISEYRDEDELFLLTLASGTQAGQGTRLMVLLDPTESESNTSVNVEDGCGVVDFTADLSGLMSLTLPVDGGVVEWSTLGRTGLGNDLVLGNVDGVMLAFYEGLTVADLEPQFLDLELIATSLYTVEIAAGSGADLATATTADGQTFGGFSGDGTWLLALTCSTCANPAPLFMTVVEAE